MFSGTLTPINAMHITNGAPAIMHLRGNSAYLTGTTEMKEAERVTPHSRRSPGLNVLGIIKGIALYNAKHIQCAQ